MTPDKPNNAGMNADAKGVGSRPKNAGLAAEEKAALDHVQVSAVGDVSESGKIVGGARSGKERDV